MFKADAVQVPALKVFATTGCSGGPTIVAFFPSDQCSDYYLDQCYVEGSYSYSVSCADSYKEYTESLFGNSPYLFVEMYVDGTSCGSFDTALVYPLDGQCHGMPYSDVGTMVTLNSDKSVTMTLSTDTTCSQMDQSTASTTSSNQINSNVCVEGSLKMYSNVDTGSTTTTSATTTTGDISAASTYFVAQTAIMLVAVLGQTIFAL